MPTAAIIVNVVRLTVGEGAKALNLDMSLQRHHYRYCAGGGALAMNSLMYAGVTDALVTVDVLEVGRQMERLLDAHHRPQTLFGVEFRCPSGRIYLVDNTALDPNGFPNHFFPVGGTSVWERMTQNEYAAASALRRVEEAIQARPAASRGEFLNGRDLAAKKTVMANPIIAAYHAAHTAFMNVPAADANLIAVSGRPDLVALVRAF